MTIYAVVETLIAGYDCEKEMVKSLGFKEGNNPEVFNSWLRFVASFGGKLKLQDGAHHKIESLMNMFA